MRHVQHLVDVRVDRVHGPIQRLSQFFVGISQNLESSYSSTGSQVSEPVLGGRGVATEEGGGGEGGVNLLGHPVVGKYHALCDGVVDIQMLCVSVCE